MRDLDVKKKKKNGDLPANRSRAKEQQLLKAGKEPTDSGKTALKSTAGPAELEEMKNRLAVSKDSRERKMLLGTIQEHFGNEMAEKVVTELRMQKQDKEEKEEKEEE